jgi:protein SCO1/2
VVLPRINLAPCFNLIDQNGDQISNEHLRGGITLYNFTYTNCDGDCPQTTPLMAEVHEQVAQLETGGIPVHLVTMTIDPDVDSEEQMAAYAETHNADPDIWHFISGSPVQLKSVIGGGFSIYYTKKDGEVTFDPAFMLVDGNGVLRAEYRTATPDKDVLLLQRAGHGLTNTRDQFHADRSWRRTGQSRRFSWQSSDALLWLHLLHRCLSGDDG